MRSRAWRPHLLELLPLAVSALRNGRGSPMKFPWQLVAGAQHGAGGSRHHQNHPFQNTACPWSQLLPRSLQSERIRHDSTSTTLSTGIEYKSSGLGGQSAVRLSNGLRRRRGRRRFENEKDIASPQPAALPVLMASTSHKIFRRVSAEGMRMQPPKKQSTSSKELRRRNGRKSATSLAHIPPRNIMRLSGLPGFGDQGFKLPGLRLEFPVLHVDRKLTFWGNMIAGAVSRSCAQTALHPANVVKTLLQTKSADLQNLSFRVLTRGAGAQFALSLPHGALAFAVLETVKSTLFSWFPVKFAGPAFDFVSSAVSTTLCSVISTPQMVLTDRIMAGYYPNLLTGIRTILKTDGIPGLYSGWFAALAQKIPSYGLTWVFFQQLKVARNKLSNHDATNTENFIMGAMAAAATVCVMMPLDTIKTRIVTQRANPNLAIHYTGILNCLTRVYKEEGIEAFYAALTPRLVSVVPMIGVQFGVYEFMRKLIATLPERPAVCDIPHPKPLKKKPTTPVPLPRPRPSQHAAPFYLPRPLPEVLDQVEAEP